jgi:hypothetical protein
MRKKLDRFRANNNDQEIKGDKPLNFTFDLHGSRVNFKKRDPESMP